MSITLSAENPAGVIAHAVDVLTGNAGYNFTRLKHYQGLEADQSTIKDYSRLTGAFFALAVEEQGVL